MKITAGTKEFFNVILDEKGSRVAIFQIVNLETNNILDEVSWALDNLTTALDYLTVKKMMKMSVNNTYLEEIKVEKQQITPLKNHDESDEAEIETVKPAVESQFQRRTSTINAVRGVNKISAQPQVKDENVATLVKKILDIVEGHQTVYDFSTKNDFYKFLDEQYGDGNFRSAPKLNELDVPQLKQLYRKLIGA